MKGGDEMRTKIVAFVIMLMMFVMIAFTGCDEPKQKTDEWDNVDTWDNVETWDNVIKEDIITEKIIYETIITE
jgi:hypothetical protein